MPPIVSPTDGVLLFTVVVAIIGAGGVVTRVIRGKKQHSDYGAARAAAQRELRPGVLAWVERNVCGKDVDLRSRR